MDKGLKHALRVFRETARSVPAYASFLKRHKIHSAHITNEERFSAVPCTDKKNYLRAYPFFHLFPGGKVPAMISASSGSSGEPFYWPRGDAQEMAGGKLHEDIFRDIFGIKKKKTLVVVCFSMGNWIAGTFTAACVRYVASQGYQLSVVTPGIEKEDALNVLKRLAPLFECVVLAGYPPFLMDIVYEAKERGILLKHLRLLLAGEGFSEGWRDTIHELAGITDTEHGSISIYGTADAAMLGHETPLTIWLRRQAMEHSQLAQALFGTDAIRLPTLVQYHPDHVYFENVDGELVFTIAGGVPLVRYNIHDTGRLIPFEQMRHLLEGVGLWQKVEENGFDRWQLPFVVLGMRKDVAITFYALNIYPENFKAGLETKRVIPFATGRFVASVRVRKQRLQTLVLTVELKRNVRGTMKMQRIIQKQVTEQLMTLNSEYRKLYAAIGTKATPKIVLVPYGSSEFLQKKSKHQWVKR